MRTKLRYLREYKSQRFIKNVFKQKFHAQRLVLEKAKKVHNPNMYLGKSQHTLNKYVSQVDLVFQTKPLTYASKEVKCLYTAAFLSGISQRK